MCKRIKQKCLTQIFKTMSKKLEKEPQMLYHYTTLGALTNGILGKNRQKNEEICLWASDYRYMNDPEEIKTGQEILQSVLKQKKYQNFQMGGNELDYYFTSFSELADNSYMWKKYGDKGKGVSLGFDASILKQWLCLHNADLRKVNYVNKLCPIKEDNINIICGNIPRMKNKREWSKEKEYRIIKIEYNVQDTDKDNSDKKQFCDDICFRCNNTNGDIIPYFKLYFPLQALKEIYIGPKLNPDKIKDSLTKFLYTCGIPLANIKDMDKTPIPTISPNDICLYS